MEMSRFTRSIVESNEKEIKECLEFMADMQSKIDYMKQQNRELKGVDDVRRTNSQDSKRSAS